MRNAIIKLTSKLRDDDNDDDEDDDENEYD